MKITAIQTTEIRIPLRTPFKTALRTVDSVHDVLVRIQTDTGEVGYGEAPPTAVITGDTIGSIRNAIEEFIAPALVGMDVEDLDCVMTRLDRCILKNTSAKAAVDMAIYDLYAKSCGKPLYRVLGGAKKEIETDLTISVNPIPQMVADAHEAVNRGFNILKIKVGKEGLKDVARLRAIREAVGPGVVIRVDAHQICAIAETCGVQCMIGCMLESKIAVSAAAHLAAARSVVTRADLDGPSLCSEDPYTGGPVFEGSRILMNEAPGLGITAVPGFED